MKDRAARPLPVSETVITRLLREAWDDVARGEEAWLAVLERLLADGPSFGRQYH